MLLFAVQLAVCSALPWLLWELDFRALWPYTDWFRKAPVVLESLLEVLEGVCMILVLLLQLAVSTLAAVHWPLFLPVAGEPYLSVVLLEAASSLFPHRIARFACSRCSIIELLTVA